jgi:MinD superfamily P-loop ATPase
MKELVIASGKGGTGKTSIVAALAGLATDTVLADCDVDAADLYLLLNPEIESRQRFLSGHEAVIDQSGCTACGVCADVCHFDAIAVEATISGPPRYRCDPFRCEGCGVCVHFCADRAIEFPVRDCGEWFVSRTAHGPFVHARLKPAAENSGKLVTLVRREAKKIAAQRGSKLILVDGPPGIGCPVIAAVGGADLLLAVTEPSLAATHDLQRLVALARHFRVPVCVCVNKFDLNREQTAAIAGWCDERALPVVGLIPYDPQVTAAQLAGTNFVAWTPSAAGEAVRGVWEGVRRLLAGARTPEADRVDSLVDRRTGDAI